VPTVTTHLPQPLGNAPIPLLADERTQMSFGERAALEGVLLQLRPKIALEVGSAAGGSLARIAAYSHSVHSFDLVLPADEVAALGNVTCHTGDSHKLLPATLASLAGRGCMVEFAFVDGDHTPEGAREDLSALLDSSATPSTVILLHDTANLDVRLGVELAIAAHAKIVYHELDFVPGREFAEGPFANQWWGGLGLVITGDRRNDGYRGSPAQTLYRPL
jgi:hypothetical protein